MSSCIIIMQTLSIEQSIFEVVLLCHYNYIARVQVICNLAAFF